MDETQDAFLRLAQIIGDKKRGIPAIIPVSKSTWWDGCKTGRFPKPVHLGPKTAVWPRSVITALVEKLKG